MFLALDNLYYRIKFATTLLQPGLHSFSASSAEPVMVTATMVGGRVRRVAGTGWIRSSQHDCGCRVGENRPKKGTGTVPVIGVVHRCRCWCIVHATAVVIG
jgi:hypothetical protein